MTEPTKHPDAEPATEAVAFDPFADDEPGTEAVPFDPFADEDDEDSDGTDFSELGEMAGLLKDLDDLRRGSVKEDTSSRSRRRALDTSVSYTHLTLPTTPYV